MLFVHTTTRCQIQDHFTNNSKTKCEEAVVRMASQFQVPTPESFSFRHPEK